MSCVGNTPNNDILLCLRLAHLVHGFGNLSHATHNSLQVAAISHHVLKASSEEFTYSDHLFDLKSGDRVMEAVELEDTVWFAIIANDRCQHEIFDVLECFQVVTFR